jgi:hypothetical protein
MATIKQVEARIFNVEGFEVRLLHGRDARDVRSDKANVKQYGYERALSGSKSVKDWRDGRFAAQFPGFTVQVLMADSKPAHGRSRLDTVRNSYRPSS